MCIEKFETNMLWFQNNCVGAYSKGFDIIKKGAGKYAKIYLKAVRYSRRCAYFFNAYF